MTGYRYGVDVRDVVLGIMSFLEDGLFARNVLHFTRTGNNVFGHSMKNFIRRALN